MFLIRMLINDFNFHSIWNSEIQFFHKLHKTCSANKSFHILLLGSNRNDFYLIPNLIQYQNNFWDEKLIGS